MHPAFLLNIALSKVKDKTDASIDSICATEI